jgi:hypothetical protein
MVRSLSRVIFILTLSTLFVMFAFAQGEQLRYQAEKGVSHQYKINSDVKQKMQMMGQEFTSLISNAIELSLEGNDVKDGNLIFIGKIDKNLSKIDSPMMKDTAMVSKDINGKRVQIVVTPLGKTLKTTAIDSIPAPANPMMGNIVNPTEMMRRLFVELPEKALGIGDTWKQTRPDTTNAQGMKIISKPDITYKVAGSEKKSGFDCLKITFEGTASQYGTGSRQGMELVIDGTSKSKGTAYFAVKSGILVSVESSTTNDTNISGAGEQMFNGTQSVTANSKMVLVK